MDGLKKRVLSSTIFFLVALAVFLFLPAWTLNYPQAWIYWLIFSGSVLFITFYFLKHDPALLERRMKAGAGDEKEKSQKIIQAISSFFFMAMLIFPGIDHHFHWSAVPRVLVIAADFLVLAGFIIVFNVFKVNSFTSGIIEVDKEQKVISTGPYAVVRHPMYAGALYVFWFTPIALGSYWALFASFFSSLLLVVRLLDEEKFLSANLEGYSDYCKKVTCRLIPGIW